MTLQDSDIRFFLEMLSIDSTSGSERPMAEWLAARLKTPGNEVHTFEVGDGTLNVRCDWGTPRVFLCSHCDTVPPYFPPVLKDGRIEGRGTCDAKGQIFSMFLACKQMEAMGMTDFGLLVLSGEETGSFGAKAYTRDCQGAEAVIVGEPTGNAMVTASKGTRAFTVRIAGRPCHSGYPQLGESAVDKFIDIVNRLRSTVFPMDPELGGTTWNIGRLSSDNPQNILSPELTFKIYFRTTFASQAAVEEIMASLAADDVEVTPHGGDDPMRYWTLASQPLTTVAFGSDAPRLGKFGRRALCGPGSIEVAHTEREHILLRDVEKAVEQYIEITKTLLI